MRLFLTFLYLIILSPPVLALNTPSDYFNATLPLVNSIAVTGGNFTTSIDVNTGALSAALNPQFTISTNSNSTQNLTASSTANIQGTTVNSIFNISTTKYIILTNTNHLPAQSAIDNIKSGSPSAANNPNAIAYQINDPTASTGLTVTYNNTNKNWGLVLSKKGSTITAIAVPASTPLAQTYSILDQAGTYQATIILTFN